MSPRPAVTRPIVAHERAAAGLASITWPVISQSNSIRKDARCCLTVGTAMTVPSLLWLGGFISPALTIWP